MQILKKHSLAGKVVTMGLGVLMFSAPLGCQEQASRAHGEQFTPEDQPRAVNRFTDVQAAAGARLDATLRADHFCGEQLNSLGRHKLDLMLKDDDACTPMVVYLDIPQDELSSPRQRFAAEYLRDRGMLESQYKFEAGPNTKYASSAADGLRALHAYDTVPNTTTAGPPSGLPSGTNR